MPGNKLLENFLISSLDNETFKHLLSLVNREKGIFKLFCEHKNSSNWEEEQFAVFKEWDVLKGRHVAENDMGTTPEANKLLEHFLSLVSGKRTFKQPAFIWGERETQGSKWSDEAAKMEAVWRWIQLFTSGEIPTSSQAVFEILDESRQVADKFYKK
ncbi:hypothetical protein HNY73_015381 [Argiope bruennichi]|uniref:IRF tryptophan pentad repeat domain-containing protein n=1 Tax=Argiope bruennichi TaxID=94029 RepID=A0A8T0ETF2_ARGBR|nr:hypothetical protein HNY73_015381 [Argiope bruennichi]